MNLNIRPALTRLYLSDKLHLRLSTSARNALLESAAHYYPHDQVRVAFICDEMTWYDYADYAASIYVHPVIWRQQMERFHPDILFCESAWCGIDAYPDCWRGRIYKDKRITFENRRDLLDILSYCRSHGIRTVFWNKEDPILFEYGPYDFVSTALLFDDILTTASECVPLYKNRGHSNVRLMPFGVNPRLFHETGDENRVSGTAIFPGSWDCQFNRRCTDMEALFHYVLKQGMRLVIYDRQSGRHRQQNTFPKQYRPYIRSCVPYQKLSGLFGYYEYGLNVNTVTSSQTMISRRFLQLAATGIKIISNDSKAYESMPGIRVEQRLPGTLAIISSDTSVILEQYSTERQMNDLFNYVNESVRGACHV